MRRKPNPDSEANIRRIDTKSHADKQTHGFQVHFMRGTTVVTKMFSDRVYGGRDQARRAARKFRSAAIRVLPQRGFRSRVRKAKHSKGPLRSRRRRSH